MAATNNVYVEVKSQLVTKLTTALATSTIAGGQVQVSYAWPGPGTKHEAVFCGRLPFDGPMPASEYVKSDVATIKAGRKQRQQDFVIPVTFFSFRPDLTVADAATAEAQGFKLLRGLDNILADDPTLALSTIQHALLGDVEVVGGGPITWEKGWASVLVADVDVKTRIT